MQFDPTPVLQSIINPPKPDVLNPLELAISGQSLRSTFLKNQLEQMNVQQAQDYQRLLQNPQYQGYIASLLTGGGGGMGGMPGGMPGGAAGDPNAPQATQADQIKALLAGGGTGVGKAMESITAAMKTGVDLRAKAAEASEHEQKARSDGLQHVANDAARIAAQDTVTPMDAQVLAANTAHAQANGWLPPGFPTMPSVTDQAGIKNWAGNVSALSTSAKDQFDIQRGRALMPGEIAKQNADIQEVWTRTFLQQKQAGVVDKDAASRATQAAAAFGNMQTERQKYLGGTTVQNAFTGQSTQMVPTSATDPTLIAKPVLTAAGVPAQTGATAAQTSTAAGLTPRLERFDTNVDLANRGLQIIPAIRELAKSGYNGPLQQSAAGQAILNFAGSMGIDVAPYADMRASEALNTMLRGQLGHELSQRGSNLSLNLTQQAKLGAENPYQVRMRMADALEADFYNQIAIGKAAHQYVQSNPNDLGMTNFKPPAPIMPKPAGGQFKLTVQAPGQPAGMVYFDSREAMEKARFNAQKNGWSVLQ